MAEKKETKAAPTEKKPEVLVYCGPSVRGVARQFTVYYGKLPAALVSFLAKHPAAQSLCVGLDAFAKTRAALGVKGTAEAELYKMILNEM